MYITVDVVIDELDERISIEAYRAKDCSGALKQAVFYVDQPKFSPGYIYIATASDLSTARAVSAIQKGACVICLGGPAPRAFQRGTCSCIVVKDAISPAEMLNMLQTIYEKYATWSEQILRIFEGSGDIDELLEVSFPIVQNPMVVIDAGYHFLGYSKIIDTNDDLAPYRSDKDGNVKLDYINQCIGTKGIEYWHREPLTVIHEGVTHVSFNLFNADEYIGNITVSCVLRPYRRSDDIVIAHLAHIVERAMSGRAYVSDGRSHVLKNVLRDALGGHALDSASLRFLRSFEGDGKRFLCAMLLFGNETQSTVPPRYACNELESMIPGSAAFHFSSAIVAFMQIDGPFRAKEETIGILDVFSRQMMLQAGVSNPFTQLGYAFQHYRQACVAFEIGSTINPDDLHYCFDDYALQYMTLSSAGEFAPEYLFPEGLQRLIIRDAEQQGKASYVQTLKVYLDNNMSMSKTASVLFLHRSSLLARLKRIEELLDLDLHDAEQRLRLRLALKMLENEEAGSSAKVEAHEVRDQIL